MEDINKWIIGTIITVVIGGTTYTFNQEDFVKNFAEDTGVTQEQAQDYVDNIPDSDLSSFKDIGNKLVDAGKSTISESESIDCINYEYDWQSTALTCPEGKMQIKQIGQDYISLGESYIKLDLENSTNTDIKETISLIDKVNNNLNLTIIKSIMTPSEIEDEKKTHSYNKAILKTASESER